jgi:two-component sensor histidine kinase
VLARAIGVVCHELATNAAKYRALSRPEGRLAISWANFGGQVQVTWAEEGGPSVSPPTKVGFGTYFTKRILEGVQGEIETEFRPEGLLRRIWFALPSVDARSFSHGQVSPSSPFPVAAPGGG